MFDNFLGKRVHNIRTTVFKIKQDCFAKNINEFIDKKNLGKNKYFNQTTISSFETQGKLSREKLSVLLNYMYEYKKVNPSWLLLENNNSIPMILSQLGAEKGLNFYEEELKKHTAAIENTVSQIQIFINNLESK